MPKRTRKVKKKYSFFCLICSKPFRTSHFYARCCGESFCRKKLSVMPELEKQKMHQAMLEKVSDTEFQKQKEKEARNGSSEGVPES